jgi:16S rRNA (guanine527-N7)-methyltransferase
VPGGPSVSRFTLAAVDWQARLAEIAEEHGLSAAQRARLARLLELIRDDPAAPTTVRDPADAVDRHVADSLAALDLPAVRAARALADIGAGAGFPGLPLAVALPEARVWLVESTGRKCAFLARAATAAGADNAEVACARVEQWDGRGLDVVCARALAPLPVLAEYAAPILALGGRLVAWKGRPEAAEERGGAGAAARLGLEVESIVPVAPFAGAERRMLYVYLKVSETPPGYPRRPGMARKRPLSA